MSYRILSHTWSAGSDFSQRYDLGDLQESGKDLQESGKDLRGSGKDLREGGNTVRPLFRGFCSYSHRPILHCRCMRIDA